MGDEVVARVTKDLKREGKVVAPKNSRVLGRVTLARARAEGQSESALGLQFDRVLLKDGREYPVSLALQAVAAAQSAVAASAHEDMTPPIRGGARPAPRSSGSSGGGVLGGIGSTVNSTVSATTGAVGSVAGTAGATVDSTVGGAVGADAGRGRSGPKGAVGTLTSGSTGVIGLRDLALRSESVHESSSSVLVSFHAQCPLRHRHTLLAAFGGFCEQAGSQASAVMVRAGLCHDFPGMRPWSGEIWSNDADLLPAGNCYLLLRTSSACTRLKNKGGMLEEVGCRIAPSYPPRLLAFREGCT
jgi:hypothetical protein